MIQDTGLFTLKEEEKREKERFITVVYRVLKNYNSKKISLRH